MFDDKPESIQDDYSDAFSKQSITEEIINDKYTSEKSVNDDEGPAYIPNFAAKNIFDPLKKIKNAKQAPINKTVVKPALDPNFKSAKQTVSVTSIDALPNIHPSVDARHQRKLEHMNDSNFFSQDESEVNPC